MLEYTLEHEWKEPSSLSVMEGLLSFNAEHISRGQEQKLSIVVTPKGNNEIVGGLLGQTMHGWLYVGWLWTSESYRKHGIATELMRRAEDEARRRGCHHAHLTTLEFQAREFYERRGYAVFGVLDDYPQPYKRFFMQKVL
jgi:GNAT superfamily N-acetyltransferase